MRCFASSQEYVSTAVREVLLYVEPTRQKKSLATFEMLYSTPPKKKNRIWLNPTKVVMIY